jgi:uncharacterized protein involved in exopolysaccharide biosynthesis
MRKLELKENQERILKRTVAEFDFRASCIDADSSMELEEELATVRSELVRVMDQADEDKSRLASQLKQAEAGRAEAEEQACQLRQQLQSAQHEIARVEEDASKVRSELTQEIEGVRSELRKSLSVICKPEKRQPLQQVNHQVRI